jgi:hypothetical protein
LHAAAVDGRAERGGLAVDEFLSRRDRHLLGRPRHAERGVEADVAVRLDLSIVEPRLGEAGGGDDDVVGGRFDFDELKYALFVRLNGAHFGLRLGLDELDAGACDDRATRIGHGAGDVAASALRERQRRGDEQQAERRDEARRRLRAAPNGCTDITVS